MTRRATLSPIGGEELSGMVGVLVAAPLTVIVLVLVEKPFVRDTLGAPTVAPGEDRQGLSASREREPEPNIARERPGVFRMPPTRSF